MKKWKIHFEDFWKEEKTKWMLLTKNMKSFFNQVLGTLNRKRFTRKKFDLIWICQKHDNLNRNDECDVRNIMIFRDYWQMQKRLLWMNDRLCCCKWQWLHVGQSLVEKLLRNFRSKTCVTWYEIFGTRMSRSRRYEEGLGLVQASNGSQSKRAERELHKKAEEEEENGRANLACVEPNRAIRCVEQRNWILIEWWSWFDKRNRFKPMRARANRTANELFEGHRRQTHARHLSQC